VRFVTGHGSYTDDLKRPGQLYGYVVRSPHAHAEIRAIDLEAARNAPGVAGILTSSDLEAMGVGPLPCLAPVKNRDGSPQVLPLRPVLAAGRVHFVGEGVAFVLADTFEAARDAAELVEIDYEELPAVGTVEAALAPGAPLVWDEAAGNVAFDWQAGKPEETEAAFARAARVVRLDLVHNRIVPNSMEARACVADYDATADRVTLTTSSQGSHALRDRLSTVMGTDPERLRVVTPDVGGGFGMKLFPYPEHVLAVVAARVFKRPVRWTSGRDEAFLSDTHGRNLRARCELALDSEGRILALRVASQANLGAYNSTFGPMIPTMAGGRVLGGVYQISAVTFEVQGVFTNSAPVDAYRGAGRPEVAYMIERLMDAAGRETGLGPVEIRKRNFIPPEAMPYQNWCGIPFDYGEFARNLDDALKFAQAESFPQRRSEARRRGKLRGLGISYYVEITAGGSTEYAEIRVRDDEVEVIVGTQSNGQGHETSFAQLVAEQLGVPFETVRVRNGDSDALPGGGGTGGSRSLHMAGGAIERAVDALEEKGKSLAGHLLEAAPADIEFRVEDGEGRFRIVGTDRSVGLFDLARAARNTDSLPPDLAEEFAEGLAETAMYKGESSTFPNGCHVCEIEIDEATGVAQVVAYHVVDDFGRVINPMIVEGQVQGGVAQGIGQALYEDCVYDPDSGQLVTGSFMDYCMPRATDMPAFRIGDVIVPATTNPLGVKGAGEAGTTASLAAVMNAIADAVPGAAAAHMDMPATPEKVWQACRQA
jgi:carbon-monoxide dehydrogenase large subunit